METKWERMLNRGQKIISIDFPFNQYFATILRNEVDAK